MRVTMYGMADCDDCDRAKARLDKMGIAWGWVDLGARDGGAWRRDGSVEAMAVHQDWGFLPVVRVGNGPMLTWVEAMRIFRKVCGEGGNHACGQEKS